MIRQDFLDLAAAGSFGSLVLLTQKVLVIRYFNMIGQGLFDDSYIIFFRIILSERNDNATCCSNGDTNYLRVSISFEYHVTTLIYFRVGSTDGTFLWPNSPGPLTDDWKVMDDSSVNSMTSFFFIFF